MRSIKLTTEEEICQIEILYNHKTCSYGCIFEEMINSKKDCDECKLTKSVYSVLEKLEAWIAPTQIGF